MAIPRKLSTPLLFAALAPIVTFAAARLLQTLALRRLNGKTVVITGGSRGLGLELARQSLSHGARVAICARHSRELKRASSELTKNFGEPNVFATECDITDGDDAQSFINDVVTQLVPVRLLPVESALKTDSSENYIQL